MSTWAKTEHFKVHIKYTQSELRFHACLILWGKKQWQEEVLLADSSIKELTNYPKKVFLWIETNLSQTLPIWSSRTKIFCTYKVVISVFLFVCLYVRSQLITAYIILINKVLMDRRGFHHRGLIIIKKLYI